MMDGMSTIKTSEWQLRVDLAAAFRLAAKFDWQEAVANHFSLAVSEDGKKFLMNSRWVPFSRVKASDLVVLDSEASAPPAYPIIEKPPGRSMARSTQACRRPAVCCTSTRLMPRRSPA